MIFFPIWLAFGALIARGLSAPLVTGQLSDLDLVVLQFALTVSDIIQEDALPE